MLIRPLLVLLVYVGHCTATTSIGCTYCNMTGSRYTSTLLDTLTADNERHCGVRCALTTDCQAYNWMQDDHVCQLLTNPDGMVTDPTYTAYSPMLCYRKCFCVSVCLCVFVALYERVWVRVGSVIANGR